MTSRLRESVYSPGRAFRRLLLAAAALALPATALAQDDPGAWRAMVTSPYGALVPGVTPAMLGMAEEAAAFGGDLEFRYGLLDGDAVRLHSLGLGARLGNLGIVGAWQLCNGCSQRSLAGLEYDFVLSRVRFDETVRATSFVTVLRPALGLGLVSGEGDAVVAVATTVDLPMSLAVPLGPRLWLIPHVEPGVGNGLAVQEGDREGGFHGAIAAGITLLELWPGIGINVGYRRILLADRPGTWGLGVTLRRDMEEGLGEQFDERKASRMRRS